MLDHRNPAAKPEDARDYTHRLAFEFGATPGIFSWLSERNWLRNVTAYTLLDYIATSLPEAGDEVPQGGQIYLDEASGWPYWAGINLPIAPVVP